MIARYLHTKHKFLELLFLISLALCLWLGYVPTTSWQAGFGKTVAQTADANQLVQQGIKRYQAAGTTRKVRSEQPSSPTEIVEARGEMMNNKNEVMLIATAPADTLDIPWVP